jgi:thymidylate synthase
MKQYIELGKRILAEGELRHDRTGVGTISVFGANMTFDLRERFPLVTVKETRWKTAFLEMLWFLRGEDNTDFLLKHGCRLWDAWADQKGYVGPIYGVNWRAWVNADGSEPYDQVRILIDGLKNNPHGRRHLVSAWNVSDLNDMALPPCHWAHQCYVSNDGHLDLKLFLRSSDFALGLPFNIAQYALLTHLYARAAGLTARRLIVDIGDAHIYSNHVEAMREVLERKPLSEIQAFDNTRLFINTGNIDIDRYTPDDFNVCYYEHHDHVALQVAV